MILLVDPVVGLATGVLWFGERLTATPATLLGALVGVAVTVGGIALAQAAGHDEGPPRGRAPHGGPPVGAGAGAVPGARPAGRAVRQHLDR